MPSKHSATTREQPERLLGKIRKHLPYRHQLTYEWPYIAGATCLLVLLIGQPFRSTMPPAYATSASSAQSAQRSLREIDSNCYQVRNEMLAAPPCQECDEDKVSATHSDQFIRSILTCWDLPHDPLRVGAAGSPDNMLIEVMNSNHSF